MASGDGTGEAAIISSADTTIRTPRPDFTRALMEPSGRVVHDERGNAQWNWSEEGVSRAENLGPAALSVVDSPTTVEPLKRRPGAGEGYDPYGRLQAGRRRPATKKTDLRELSRQIELSRQAIRKPSSG